MAQQAQGVLITCDIPTKQYILFLNEEHKFLIRDLDDTHLFIDASAVQLVKDEIHKFTEENVYTAPEEKA